MKVELRDQSKSISETNKREREELPEFTSCRPQKFLKSSALQKASNPSGFLSATDEAELNAVDYGCLSGFFGGLINKNNLSEVETAESNSKITQDNKTQNDDDTKSAKSPLKGSHQNNQTPSNDDMKLSPSKSPSPKKLTMQQLAWNNIAQEQSHALK